MNLLLLGRGKTGSLVEQVARERGHNVAVLTSRENVDGKALTTQRLKTVDAVIDFTNPHAVLDNILACVRERVPIVVGTTGWYDHLSRIEIATNQAEAAVLWGSNFSVGVNLFFEIAATGAAALKFGYSGEIEETHHVHKKDAPSGTAVSIQRIAAEAAGVAPEIRSIREGDVVGTHVLTLASADDRIVLIHEAKSRRGFANGAVRAAEWLKGKTGFFEFRKIFRELPR